MDIRRNRALPRTQLLLLMILACAGLAAAQTQSTCLECHSALSGRFQVTAEKFAQDIHSQKGLTCASCHGGDPTKADLEAMSKKAGFSGKVERSQIPALCGRCHSDGAFMRQYNPSLRTDQLSQYKTTVHGKLLAKGETKVAVCTDCHGVHDLRPASDTRSKVHPLNVAQTCARCHADTAWHGNHAAAPPGVDSGQNVCSKCPVFQNQMYEKSTHKVAFQSAGLPGCVVCHSNHGITHPTDAKLAPGPQAVCMQCHTPGDACDQARAEMLTGLTRLDSAVKDADKMLGIAESSGMEVSQARLDEDQARDSLTKARVTIHSFRKDLVDQDIQEGLKLAAKNLQAGKNALAERDYRRRGLGYALVFILITVVGLFLYIRQSERKMPNT